VLRRQGRDRAQDLDAVLRRDPQDVVHARGAVGGEGRRGVRETLHGRTYTRGEWLDQVPTTGDHSQFPPAKLAELLAGIGAAIDAAGGHFTMRYTALAVTAARTSAA
jgi:hypothetical protein